MKILDKYLWGATLQSILLAWVALVILSTFFSFIAETGKTNALYTTYQAAIYMVYTLPGRFYEFFPNAVLIGTLLGLGNLAANSEFIAMRAAGVSISQIIFSVIKLGLILVIVLFIIGEWIVPATDLHARNFKAHLKNKNIVLVGGEGLWVKEKNSIVHIGKVLSEKQLSDISIYTFNKDHSALESLSSSKKATATDNNWVFQDFTSTTFEEAQVKRRHEDSVIKNDFINPDILSVATVDPEQLSSSALHKIIKLQKENDLKTDRYEIIYWKRFAIPFSTIVMLIIAMPFLFGSTRGGGAGAKIVIGIIIGIVFHLINRAINDLGVVNGFSPIASAFLPSVVFLFIGLFAISRIR